MSIIENLEAIQKASKGCEVRQAIHDGIEQCYNDGKAGAIDLQARQAIAAKPSVDDSNIKTTDTYSSSKIEALITNSNYKQATLKQTITGLGTADASAYIYQLANLVMINLDNVLIASTLTSYTLLTYSSDIPVPLYSSVQTIGNATIAVTAGSREIKITTSSGGATIKGMITFLVTATAEYSDTTITDIQTSLTSANAKIDAVNEIPSTYVRKNLLKNTATSQTLNGVTFTVNDDSSITANGTASNNIIFVIATKPNLANLPLVLSGCPTSGSMDNYYIVYSNQINQSYVDYGHGASFDSQFDLTQYPDTQCRITVKSGAVLNNVTFKPMIRLATVTDATYEPFVDDAQTRMIALESKIATLQNTILAMGSNV